MIDFDPQERAFFEYIKNDIPDLDEKLFEDIAELGVENVDQWEDAFVCSMPTSIFVEAQFTEQLMDDLGYLSESISSNSFSSRLGMSSLIYSKKARSCGSKSIIGHNT